MKRFQIIFCTLFLLVTLSSTSHGGNIGGLRANATGNIGGLRTNAVGNIGGLRSTAVGNIGGSRSDVLVGPPSAAEAYIDVEMLMYTNIDRVIGALLAWF